MIGESRYIFWGAIPLILILLVLLPASGADNVSVTPVTTPFITIDSIGNHSVGEVFFVNGTTNLPVSPNITTISPYCLEIDNTWLPSSTESSSGPFITIDPIGIRSKEKIIFINGSTNLPVSKKITIEITDFRWFYSGKTKAAPEHPGPESYRLISNISIVSPLSSSSETNPWTVRNQWSANITDSIRNLKNADYLIEVYSSINYGCNTSGCSSPEAIASQIFRLTPENITCETIVTRVKENYTSPPINGTTTQPPTTQVAPTDPFSFIIFSGIIMVIKILKQKKE